MAVIRPFRFLRPDPTRVALDALVCDDDIEPAAALRARTRDPRHASRLLFETGDGIDLVVADQVRAGVWRHDERPAITVVRQQRDVERLLVYAAMRADAAFDVEPMSQANQSYAAAPALFRFVDKKGRIARAVEAETEREPDAVVSIAAMASHNDIAVDAPRPAVAALLNEVWVVDDESAVARIASLLESAELSLVDRSRAEWGRARARGPASWGFACFVGVDDDGSAVPVGLSMLPLRGALSAPVAVEP
jgi:hypothetical protein